MTKIVSFYTQKGGCGKTTLTVVSASYLAYVLHRSVLVIDADPQHSLSSLREDEMDSYDSFFRRRMDERGVGEPYEIRYRSLREAVSEVRREIASGAFDYVFVDLPGTINDPDVVMALSLCDCIIVPLEHNVPSFKSSIASAAVISHAIRRSVSSRISSLSAVFNDVPHTQTGKLSAFMDLIRMAGFDYLFPSVIGHSHTMGDSNHVCTLLPPDEMYLMQKGEKLNLGGFCDCLAEYLGAGRSDS